ncbi:ATPase, partial [Metarhizium majus ARSEF 297]
MDGQPTHQNEFDDFIKGKGQGLTILLVGTPGTGKTLTAEAVADKVRRPLYILSAGELGQEAQKVEEKLKHVVELTEKWRAVLLLDECDVFLEKRTHNNLNHSEAIAIFLWYLFQLDSTV